MDGHLLHEFPRSLLCVCACIQIPSSYQYTSHWIRPLMTSFYLNFLLKDPISKQSHILRFWILEPQLMNFWRRQFNLSQPWSFKISELLFSLSSLFLLSGLVILEWRNKEEGVQSQWRPRGWLHHRSGVDALSFPPVQNRPSRAGTTWPRLSPSEQCSYPQLSETMDQNLALTKDEGDGFPQW